MEYVAEFSPAFPTTVPVRRVKVTPLTEVPVAVVELLKNRCPITN